ncbi:hypothetical protein [Streptomyces jumonjinensis]|uniref:hypothetical protein n=1 Tax=Streptomyces jumonjinensis TaxID=1945 RepID=UPI0037A760EC
MMYPLVRGPAVGAAPHRVPVVVTCRVLKLARQPYYRWLACPVSDAEVVEAYRADALFDAHRDDLEFGHRFLLDEARAAREPMAERTAWRICRETAGEAPSASEEAVARTSRLGRRSTMTGCAATSPPTGRTGSFHPERGHLGHWTLRVQRKRCHAW